MDSIDRNPRVHSGSINNILPLWISHYSLGSSLLTFEERGKAKPNGPKSIIDLAVENDLKQVVVVDRKLDGFIEAYKNLSKEKISLIFGVKLTVCSDHNDKTDNSRISENDIIIFIRNTQGYHDLIRIYNRATTEGFYYKPRTDYAWLKEFWTSNLVLALPFFSSFIARNTLYFSSIVPDFPVDPWILREIKTDLPFAFLIDEALDRFNVGKKYQEQKVKTICCASRADFKPYTVFRAISKGTTFNRPQVDHLSSMEFSLESWKELL